jgi:beta-xylosidase
MAIMAELNLVVSNVTGPMHLAVALVDFIDRGGNWQDRNIRAIVSGSDYNWLSTYLVLAMSIVLYCGVTSRLL